MELRTHQLFHFICLFSLIIANEYDTLPFISSWNNPSILSDTKSILSSIPKLSQNSQYRRQYQLTLHNDVSIPMYSQVWTPGEYEDVHAILVVWGLFNGVIIEIAYWLSTLEVCEVYVIVHDPMQHQEAQAYMEMSNVNMEYVSFIFHHVRQDIYDPQFWIRDFGPRAIFVDGKQAFLDFTFDKTHHTRSNDVPKFLGQLLQFPVYEFDLEFSGGNLQVSSSGHGFMTDHILHENPGKTQNQIKEILKNAFGLKTITIYKGLSFDYDGTNHIDMWMMFLSDKTVLVGEYKFRQPGYEVTETAVSDLKKRGFNVRRIKQRTAQLALGGVHESYTNSLIANDIVLVPQYNTDLDVDAIITWKTLLPEKLIVKVDAGILIANQGALHCVTQHIYSDHALRMREAKSTDIILNHIP